MDITNDLDARFEKLKATIKGKIVILSGGDSTETSASLITGKNVFDSLKKTGLNIEMVDPSSFSARELIDKLQQSTLVFNALHGGKGEDGTIQGFLDFCKIPYTGSGLEASVIGKNKLLCKRIWSSVGIPVPKWVIWEKMTKNKFLQLSVERLKLPFVIKVPNEGSGQGVYLINNINSAQNILKKYSNADGIFAEKYIRGKEVATIVIQYAQNIIISPVLEEIGGNSFMDKTLKDGKEILRTIPASLPPEVTEKIKQLSKKAFEIINCRDYARFDIRLSRKNVPYFLEATILPSIKNNSRLPAIFRSMGMDIDQTIKFLVCVALERISTN